MTSAAAFAILMAGTDRKAFAEAIQEAPRKNVTDVSDFWSKFYDNVGTDRGPRGNKGLPLTDRKTVYLQCPDSQGMLNYADNLDRKTLPAIEGDVLVKMAVSQYRPGTGDVSSDVTQLRIDASQNFNYMNIVAPLSWAAIASFTPPKDTKQTTYHRPVRFSGAGNRR